MNVSLTSPLLIARVTVDGIFCSAAPRTIVRLFATAIFLLAIATAPATDALAQSCDGAQAGTPCSDGSICTVRDACDGDGRCIGVPARSNEDVLDFSSIPQGAIVDETVGAAGFGPVGIKGTNPALGEVPNAAVIYDTSCPGGCSGDDPDLGTPNEDFGGPGRGDGGKDGGIAPNTQPKGNALIIARDLNDGDNDGLVDMPSDQEHLEVTQDLDFSAIAPVTFLGITLIDVEVDEETPILDLFAEGDVWLGAFELPHSGDNGVAVLMLEGVEGVVRARVTLFGSAAIDDVRFRTDCTIPACFDDSDCLEGEVCRDGVCLPGCTTDSDCPEGTICTDGACQPGECSDDADCAEGEICVDDRCQPAECTDDADCPQGEICLDGRCESGACTDDPDCPDGRVCVDGFCQPGECTEDADCPEGEICVDNNCEPAECTSNEDCPEGEICLNGRCHPAECTSDADCPEGEICVGGLCEPAECSDDTDCPEGQFCVDGRCTDTECQSDDDCPEGEICIDGVCQPSRLCGDGEDCADLDSFCGIGFCDETNQTCAVEPQNEGLDCETDDDVCTVANVCSGGECTGVPLCDPVCELCDDGTCESLCGNPFEPETSGTTIVDGLFALRTGVELEECALCVCDVNNDGMVTAVDALVIARRVVRLPQEFDCPVPDTLEAQCPAIAQFTLLAGTRGPCETNEDCGGLGVCNPANGRCSTPSRLDSGWTGLAHGADPNDIVPSRLVLDCEGPAPCGECAIVDLDPVLGNCRCANDNRSVCFSPFENDEACGGDLCQCYFGPPVPLTAGNNPTCLLNAVNAIGGSANVDEGSGTVELSLASVVHLGIDLVAPCPFCDGDAMPGDGSRDGTCVGGQDEGQGCDAQSGNTTFPAPSGGRASLDCFPSITQNISGAGLQVQVNLGTGTTELPFDLPCSPELADLSCPCRVCSGDGSIACSSDSDCDAVSAGACDGTAGVAPLPNACDGQLCEDVGGPTGRCAEGPDDAFCDLIVRADGDGLIQCLTDDDCAASAIGVDAGACTLVERRSCFLDPLVAQGAPSPVAPLAAAAYCVPPTNSPSINSVTGLPGPGRLIYQGVLDLFCASDPSATYTPGVGGCPEIPPDESPA